MRLQFLGATGTRGAALAAGATEIKIHGSYVPVRAEVVRMDSIGTRRASSSEALGKLLLSNRSSPSRL